MAKSIPSFSAEILYGFLVTEAFCGSQYISSWILSMSIELEEIYSTGKLNDFGYW